MKPIATDTSSFKNLVTDGYLYIDKTSYLRRLISKIDGRIFFISRPRRFGKSLMLSTLKSIFEGDKELFKGTAIYDSDYDWKKYPVLHLSMSSIANSSWQNSASLLGVLIEKHCKVVGINYNADLPPDGNFELLLSRLSEVSETGKFVVLIDEYDAPITGFLDKPEERKVIQKGLHDFYIRLKDHVSDIQFMMLTGVSKFTKLSIFSGLNNLTDLSMNPEYAGMLGYTHEELDGVLAPYVERFASCNRLTTVEARALLLEWYDGYRFSPLSGVKVINPVSIGRAFAENTIDNFWEKTGNSALIIDCLRKHGSIPADLDGIITDSAELDVCGLDNLSVEALLYQGGYLTIQNSFSGNIVELGCPNKEVESSLNKGMIRSLVGSDFAHWNDKALRSRMYLLEKGIDSLLSTSLEAIFAQIPHEWKITNEREAKRYFLLYMNFIGADIAGEYQSAKGRADAVLKTKDGIYVFEFKYDKTAQEALQQAKTKDYSGPWINSKLPVYVIGVNYNSATRNIDPPLIESIDK